jgi:hypothetical protein
MAAVNSAALERALVENPLPARAHVLIKEPELKLLAFHEAAVTEMKRRESRKTPALAIE